MAHTSIHAIIGLKFENIIPRNKYLLTSIIIGLILPDLDLILNYIFEIFQISDPIIYNSIFHSIFMIPILSLMILIYSEIKQKKDLKIIAVGIAIGMISHIILNLLTFQSIGIFYPLIGVESNLDLNKYINIQFNNDYYNWISAFEFFFFRLYGWMILQKVIKNPLNNHNFINKINLWIKLELYIFVLFLLLIYFGVEQTVFTNIFGTLYTLSFFIAIYITYKVRKSIN